MLTLRNVSIRFSGITALDEVSLDIPEGAIVGLIGPNGAGKTTLLNCISRYYPPSSGSIQFIGTDLLRVRPHELIRLGLTRTFQHLCLFPSMTVIDTLLLAQHTTRKHRPLTAAVWPANFGPEARELRDRARATLRRFGMTEYERWPVGALSYGKQKKIDLCRAFITEPKLLMLDEPASGLTHEEVEELRTFILSLRDRKQTSILLIEHHMDFVLATCDRVVVLDFGKIRADGPPAQIQRDPRVIEAYLGGVTDDDEKNRLDANA